MVPASTAKVAAAATATASVSTNALDPTTLDMQQQLLNKQKQLLELQQKKLELELLQTKVKLQESMKNTNPAVAVSKIPVPPTTTVQQVRYEKTKEKMDSSLSVFFFFRICC